MSGALNFEVFTNPALFEVFGCLGEGIQQATVPILRTPRPGDASASAFSGEVQRGGIRTNPNYLVAAGILGSLL